MANIINKLSLNGAECNIASTAFAKCETAADIAAKVANIYGTVNSTDFTLIEGVTVYVQFTHNNITVEEPTLNINSTGAKPIKCYGDTLSSAGNTYWSIGEVVAFTYDGTYWQVNKSMYNTYNLLKKLQDYEDLINQFKEVDPDIPPPPSTFLTSFTGSGSQENTSGPNGGIYPMYKAGSSACRKQSDTSPYAAQTGSSYALMGGGTTSISIFYYKYTSLAMYFPADEVADLTRSYITGIDLWFSTDPGELGADPIVYGEVAEVISPSIPNITNSSLLADCSDIACEQDGDMYMMHIPFESYFYVDGVNALSLLVEWAPGNYRSGINMLNYIRFHYEPMEV